MNGKILKIVNNDLYGNVDEREIVVFASFVHKKYMNRYVIFTYKDEYEKKRLYYGSVHVKENTLVVFAIRDNEINYINEFISMYMNNNFNSEYELIDISTIEKIQIVSCGDVEFDKLLLLDEIAMSNVKENIEEVEKEKKPIILYILLFLFIVMGIGLTYLKFNPDKFIVELKKLDCDMNLQYDKLNIPYVINREILFDNKDKVKSVSVTETYTFLESEKYYEFKENERQYEYFSNKGSYKYDDNSLSITMIYNDKSLVLDYKEMLGYLENEGYNCIEGKYNE